VEYKHDVIRVARVLRGDYNLVSNKKVSFVLKPASDKFDAMIQEDTASLKDFLRTEDLVIDMAYEPTTAVPSMITQLGNLYMPVEGLIDTEAEVSRLLGQLEKVQGDLEKINKKLSNRNFVERAPKEAVDVQRGFKKDLLEKQDKLTKLIDTLKPSA
jgi:valyl-tRNA synthetase